MVITDCRGELIVACSSQKDSLFSPKVVEIFAPKRAMLLCAETGVYSVTFEGDAKAIIEKVNARTESWAPYGQLIEEQKFLYTSTNNWTVSYTPREANKAAHLMAKHAISKLELRSLY